LLRISAYTDIVRLKFIKIRKEITNISYSVIVLTMYRSFTRIAKTLTNKTTKTLKNTFVKPL